MSKYIIGTDIGGTSVKLGLFTSEGRLVHKWEIRTDRSNGGEKVPMDIATTVRETIASRGIDASDVIGMGIGVPGPVKSDGTVMKCPNLGWGIFNVADRMKELSGINCTALNDANAAALGEMWQGTAKGFKNLVFVTLGTGVGGGIIVDGKVISGTHGGGGEIGHILVEPDEEDVCGCGCKGHLEQYASATGLCRVTRKFIAEGRLSTKLSADNLSARIVFDAAKAGDELAKEAVEIMCKYLAQAFSGIAATVDPEVFLIGGGVSKAGPIITDTVKKYYVPSNMNVLKDPAFELATLGNDAGIWGAAYSALDAFGV
ncbi:MAG: ROK family glucokinase [Lachnospiraceae bacterium]|nr:ROK family glucokinase [Lachnospiraceae bacterium]